MLYAETRDCIGAKLGVIKGDLTWITVKKISDIQETGINKGNLTKYFNVVEEK